MSYLLVLESRTGRYILDHLLSEEALVTRVADHYAKMEEISLDPSEISLDPSEIEIYETADVSADKLEDLLQKARLKLGIQTAERNHRLEIAHNKARQERAVRDYRFYQELKVRFEGKPAPDLGSSSDPTE